MKIVRILATAAVLSLLVTGLSLTFEPREATAATGSQFDPGNIISDAYFFDGAAMNSNEIQTFLRSKVASCSSGYTCLKDYSQSTRNIAPVSGRCGAYSGSPSESAAMIIAKVGAACNISQRVLLATLQKEQSLVTSTAPGETRYRIAMGYGCPDTAPCNAEYFGFQNQLYRAALQFQTYRTNPTYFNHQPYRVNNVRFSPTASCGSSPVYIQNYATAALYNYTPYQPNAAALANLYGEGDGCSSYGNRNFWRLYTDWFGPTTTSALLKSSSSAAVFIASGDKKYPLPSEEFLSIYAALGPVSVVSQAHLDSYATGQAAGRIFRNTAGAIYFTDASYRIPFATCEQVVNFGGSCLGDGYVQLTNSQASLFYSPPGLVMSNVLGTNSGSRYYIKDAQKQEILDNQSQVEAGIPLGHAVLTDRAVSGFVTGVPIVRDSVVVTERGSSATSLFAESKRFALTEADSIGTGLKSRVSGALNAESLAKLTASEVAFGGVVSEPAGTPFLLTSGGRFTIDPSSPLASIPPVKVQSALSDSYPLRGNLADGSFVKSSDSGSVYRIDPVGIRAFSSWEALVSLAPSTGPEIFTLPQSTVAMFQRGPALLVSGGLYRTPENAGVYLINGVTNRVLLGSFDVSSASGFTKFEYTSQALLSGYQMASSPLSYGIECAGIKYLGTGGVIRQIPTGDQDLYPIPFTALDPHTCSMAPKGPTAIPYIRTSSGAIYQLVAGERRPFASMARFSEVNAGQGWMQVPDAVASQIPIGAPA